MNTDDTQKKGLSRRRLLQWAAGGVAGAVGLGAAYGLSSMGITPSSLKGKVQSPPDPKAMTYRVNPRNGDKISLLGYGCMRFPMLPEATSPRGTEIDEKAVFAQVDYALAHGVNYFDTAWG